MSASAGRVALVTGGNRGLGLALVRQVARPQCAMRRVYLGARDPARGDAARRQLAAEGLQVSVVEIDLTSVSSIAEACDRIAREEGQLDVVLQNGAYAIPPGPSPPEMARTLIQTNNYGTARLLAACEPMLARDAQVVVVASGFGTLRQLGQSLRPRFHHAEFGAVETLLDEYIDALADRTAVDKGWPAWANIPSKVGQVATMRAFRRRLLAAGRDDIRVNAACPGWTRTDAVAAYLKADPNIVAREPDDAAADVIWLALGAHRFAGELVQYRRAIPWQG